MVSVSLRAGMLLVVLFTQAGLAFAQSDDTERLFGRGVTWTQFLDGARAQRELWLRTTADARIPEDMTDRFRRASRDLRLLVAAEDWCPDSVNALPYIAVMAASASVPLRIVDRTAGAPLMDRHRTPDGRVATPTIVLLRGSREAAAWVERPALVQQWFLSMATSAESARRFGDRQSWYEADRGRSVLNELTALAEQTAGGK